MKKNTINLKYLLLTLALVFVGLATSNSASADSYSYGCVNGGNIPSVVTIGPPNGPYTEGMPTTFEVSASMGVSTCTTRMVNLVAQNNGGTTYTLIPNQTLNQGGFIWPVYNTLDFTSPSAAGNYAVTFKTGVDDEEVINSCPALNMFTFVPTGLRWGRVTYNGPTVHPAYTVYVDLYGDGQGNNTSNVTYPNTTFTFPVNSNVSYHNSNSCGTSGTGCEIAGVYGYDHGVIHAGPGCNQGAQQYYSNCFVADTMVTLADGNKKDIQDIKIGDILKGGTTNNKVLGFHRPTLDGKVYSFNGGRYFVTEEHPFKTIDGWKSINPNKTRIENIGITVTDLKVGDTLVTDHGLVKLNSIDGKYMPGTTPLYNFKLDGDHTYYADGYLVHNKAQCDVSNFCSLGVACIDGGGYPITPPPSGTCAIGCIINGQSLPYCNNGTYSYCPNSSGGC